jgi:hypothetical protein
MSYKIIQYVTKVLAKVCFGGLSVGKVILAD